VFTGRVVGNVTGTLTGDVYATTVSTTNMAATSASAVKFYPSAGASNGIRFPNDPGGGSGDTAWMSYYAVSGEKTVLEIGVANDPSGAIQDSLYLNAMATYIHTFMHTCQCVTCTRRLCVCTYAILIVCLSQLNHALFTKLFDVYYLYWQG
jgi:hypothetical protein